MNAYADFIDFTVEGMTPEQIIAYQPSDKTQRRVDELIRALKDDSILTPGRAELNHHVELDHIVRMAKVKARQYVQNR